MIVDILSSSRPKTIILLNLKQNAVFSDGNYLVYLKAAENTSMIELLQFPDEESLPLLLAFIQVFIAVITIFEELTSLQ